MVISQFNMPKNKQHNNMQVQSLFALLKQE